MIPFKPKKKLGQNFIFNQNYLKKILSLCLIDENSLVIEIGSGYGNFTKLLLETNCQKVISIEKDENLFLWLKKNIKNKKLSFIKKDVLKINWETIYQEEKRKKINLVGNLPFYLSSKLIVDILLNNELFNSVSFLIQEEVAKKWMSLPGNSHRSPVSVLINLLGIINSPMKVPKNVFFPIPSVNGALVNISFSKKNSIIKEELKKFNNFLKLCFCHPRKTLFNNLLLFSGWYKKEWTDFFLNKSYDLKIRPSILTHNEFLELFYFWKSFNKKNKTR